MPDLTWPDDLGRGSLVGRFGFMQGDGPDEDRTPDLIPATTGTVTVTPSVTAVRYTGVQGPMLLAARATEGVIDADGYLCTKSVSGTVGPRGLILPATDDEDLTPTGFTYQVNIRLDGASIPVFSIALPTGATVDVGRAATIPPSGGTATIVDTTTAERAEAAAARAEAAAQAAEAPGAPPDLTGYVQDADPRLSDARPPTAHTHGIGQVTGLQTALDGKVSTGDARLSDARTPTAHTHSIADTTELQAALDGKATATHTHAYSSLTGVPTVATTAGSPIGRINPTAPGQVCVATEDTARFTKGSSLWIAATAANTSWVPVNAAAPTYDITAKVKAALPAGVTITNGVVMLTRVGPVVSLTVDKVRLAGLTGTQDVALGPNYGGFKPPQTIRATIPGATSVQIMWDSLGVVGATNGTLIDGTVSWTTWQTWPTADPSASA